MLNDPFEILLVDDNPADADLTRELFQSISTSCRIHVVSDGAAGLEFLRRLGVHGDAPRPDLIVLDLNLPGKSGHEALGQLKSDPDLRQIPVVVFTSSESQMDVVSAYDLHANCYLTKPVDLERFTRIVRAIEEFWLTLVTLPPR